jgi:hypothetical protein
VLKTKELLNSSLPKAKCARPKTKTPAGSWRYEMEGEVLLEKHYSTLPFFVKEEIPARRGVWEMPEDGGKIDEPWRMHRF